MVTKARKLWLKGIRRRSSGFLDASADCSSPHFSDASGRFGKWKGSLSLDHLNSMKNSTVARLVSVTSASPSFLLATQSGLIWKVYSFPRSIALDDVLRIDKWGAIGFIIAH